MNLIFLFFAVFFESVLICRTSKADANFTAIHSKDLIRELENPYSILLAGVGLLFAVIGLVLSMVMYFKLYKQRMQNLQDQYLNEVAETFPGVPSIGTKAAAKTHPFPGSFLDKFEYIIYNSVEYKIF